MTQLTQSDSVWKPLSEFPDYAVSNDGRVRRVVPDKYGRISGRDLRQVSQKAHRYLIVTLHREGKQTTRLVHRLVCEAFHGPAPSPSHHAAHWNGRPHENHENNLRWATPSENNCDKDRHGTLRKGVNHHSYYNPGCIPRGEGHGCAKLTDAIVAKIRDDPRSQSQICREFGISQSLVSQVKARKIWRHVP